MSVSKIAPSGFASPVLQKGVADHRPSHVVQFYREDQSLLDALSHYVGGALKNGDAAILVATRAHNEALTRELNARGVDVAAAVNQGRYATFEASDILSQIMVDGMPDGSRFRKLVGGIIERAKFAAKTDRPTVAIFGEMVALLWGEGKHAAAIRLEEHWNDLAKTHLFSLRCAYPMNGFSKQEHSRPFLKICGEHSAVIPEESYTALASEDHRLRSIAALQQKLEILERQKAQYETEQQLRLLVEGVQDYAIFLLDAEGRVQSWNSGAQRIKGYRASEIIGRHFSCFYSEEDVNAGKPARVLEIATREGRVEDEGWRIRKDGSTFWASAVITALKDTSGKVIAFGKVTRDVTDRMEVQRALEQSQRKLQDSERSLRQLSLHLLRTQDEERRRIGRELHDSLGQYLSVLKMKLDTLVRKADKSPSGDAVDLMQCTQLIDEAVKEVRTISYLLYPPMLEEMGLKSAIPWYLEGFMKRSGITTSFEVSPGFRRLQGDVELALFRVLQESLTNVHRHSGSPVADVRLSIENGAVVLAIGDRGKGVDSKNFEKSSQDWMGALGVGLRGMNERMRQLGGTLDVSSTTGGTTVTATVPISDPAQAQLNPS
jgi:PAS domain S-box-containing protein